MMRRTILLAVAMMAAFAAAPALAADHTETRHLDADTEGSAEDTHDGSTYDAEVNVTGDVTVRDTDEGVDRTADSSSHDVTAEITVGDTTYELGVLVAGEGTSLQQAGFTAAESWRLSVQGTESFDGEDAGQQQDGPDIDRASFWGNLTLIGNGDVYHVQGNGTLTVVDGQETTTYDLSYDGQATFE